MMAGLESRAGAAASSAPNGSDEFDQVPALRGWLFHEPLQQPSHERRNHKDCEQPRASDSAQSLCEKVENIRHEVCLLPGIKKARKAGFRDGRDGLWMM